VTGVLPGPDGRLRCPWALSTPEYVAYHDTEWGRPVADVAGLYERLTLEAFQSGLSWITILRKRENFRRAFAGFDPVAVAGFDEADVQRLLADAGIVRNRAKIEAAVSNAQVVAELGQDFADLVLAHRVPDRPRPTAEEWRATSPESVALSKALRRAGLRFVGPVTAYALMQAVGLVDDHLQGCWVPPYGTGPLTGR
jgi:DNA-3-methyladenine glycosylase I